MNYTILIRPHRNRRYQEGVVRLSRAELINLLRRLGAEGTVEVRRCAGGDFLDFACGPLGEEDVALLSSHSHLQMLFERREDGLLLPLCGEKGAYLGEDLAYVQKYKGKTNEAFTMHLLNQALCASDFLRCPRVELLDPMCGRGTTLFQAINRGFCATGAEIHPAEIEECAGYFKRYLEFHRVKHAQTRRSLTLEGKGVPVTEFSFAGDAEAFRAGDTRSLRLMACDSLKLPVLLRKQRFHLIVADLPYGVQHAPGAQGKRTAPFEEIAAQSLCAWRKLLAPGGAMALSFNVHTLPAERVRGLMEQAGLEVMRGEGFDGLEHFVEQAIVRDVAVGRLNPRAGTDPGAGGDSSAACPAAVDALSPGQARG